MVIERYSRPAMARIWSEESKLETWLRVELAALDAWAEVGVVPEADVRAIRERAHQKCPDAPGEQHQREQVVPVRLRVAEVHLPERHERDQPEPRDAPERDHTEQESHRPRLVRPGPRVRRGCVWDEPA